jgi:hypothetical protein
MYVRTYVRTCVCMYTCMHVYMYACIHVCMYTCTHVCMCVCMSVRADAYLTWPCIRAGVVVHTHTFTHAHTHTHTHTAREMGWAQPIDPKPLHSRLGAFEEAFDAQTAVCLIPNP